VDLHDRCRVAAHQVGVTVRDEVDVGVGARQAGRAAAEHVDLATGPPPRKKSAEAICKRAGGDQLIW